MAQTESQQVPADPPTVLTQAVAPPSCNSLPPDVQNQQPPTVVPQQVPVQPEQPQQGVPFQAWPQSQAYQYQQPAPVVGGFPQQGPVQYIAVSKFSAAAIKMLV